MDDIEQQELVSRGVAAQQLLDNELFENAFNTVKLQVIDAIESCPVDDPKFSVNLTLSLQILKRIKGAIERHVEAGKVAKHWITKMNKEER